MPKGTTGISPKLVSGWSSFPFKVTKRTSPILYEVESMNWSRDKIKVVTSLTKIKLYQAEYDNTSVGATNTNENDYKPETFMNMIYLWMITRI